MKTTIAFLILLSIGFMSCKKDSPTPIDPTLEKMAATWKIQSILQNDYFMGADHFNTIAGDPADYLEFRSNGKVYAYSSGYHDTTKFGIISTTQIWIDSPADKYDIKTLTASAFKLYQKVIYSPTEFSESTINLYR